MTSLSVSFFGQSRRLRVLLPMALVVGLSVGGNAHAAPTQEPNSRGLAAVQTAYTPTPQAPPNQPRNGAIPAGGGTTAPSTTSPPNAGKPASAPAPAPVASGTGGVTGADPSNAAQQGRSADSKHPDRTFTSSNRDDGAGREFGWLYYVPHFLGSVALVAAAFALYLGVVLRSELKTLHTTQEGIQRQIRALAGSVSTTVSRPTGESLALQQAQAAAVEAARRADFDATRQREYARQEQERQEREHAVRVFEDHVRVLEQNLKDGWLRLAARSEIMKPLLPESALISIGRQFEAQGAGLRVEVFGGRAGCWLISVPDGKHTKGRRWVLPASTDPQHIYGLYNAKGEGPMIVRLDSLTQVDEGGAVLQPGIARLGAADA